MIVKSLLKHPSTLNKKNDKMNSELFNNKLLEESSEKFVNWLLS
jgi:hypothetical protein